MGQEKQCNKLPRGVTVRKHRSGETINITFTYKGIKCREPLSNLTVNPKNIRYVERLIGEIYNKIERGIFIYAEQFPESSKLKIFGNNSKGKFVRDYLDEYLVICMKRSLSPSTICGYRKCWSALKDVHDLTITNLSPAIIKNWIKSQTTTLKTIRNQLSFLRSAIDEAVTDGLININPVSLVTASRYQSTERKKDSEYIVDPFSPREVSAILNNTTYKQWENIFRFAFYTGMRSSELCALRWSDVDFIHRSLSISQASVVGIIKGTKTKAGTRTIVLDDEAIRALTEQKEFTFLRGEGDTVFNDPRTNKAWAGADAIRKKAWIPTLRKAKIRYRNPYQTRHTFATRHISRGVNLFWLAGQMGHKGPEMLFRHYGSYLKEYDGNTRVQNNFS